MLLWYNVNVSICKPSLSSHSCCKTNKKLSAILNLERDHFVSSLSCYLMIIMHYVQETSVQGAGEEWKRQNPHNPKFMKPQNLTGYGQSKDEKKWFYPEHSAGCGDDTKPHCLSPLGRPQLLSWEIHSSCFQARRGHVTGSDQSAGGPPRSPIKAPVAASWRPPLGRELAATEGGGRGTVALHCFILCKLKGTIR